MLLGPHERLLARGTLVGLLEHGVGRRGVVDGDKTVAGILEGPTGNGLSMDHTVVNTDERNHTFSPFLHEARGRGPFFLTFAAR